MKRQTGIKIILITLIGFSLTMIAYAGFHIIYSQNAIEKSIQQWDQTAALQEGKNKGAEDEAGWDYEQQANQQEIKDSSVDLLANLQNEPQVDVMATIFLEATQQRIPVINGISGKDLQYGAGYFPQSALPGEVGNCIILGHRETVFHQLGKINVQDKLVIETATKKYVYRVVETKIVDKISDSLLDPTKRSILTLITCYPIQYTGPVSQRYLVIAEREG